MVLAIVAAMVRGIGIFAQRAGEKHSSPEQEDAVKESGASRQYALYTHYFIEKILPLPPDLEPSRGKLADLAASFPSASGQSREYLAILEADGLSVGLDGTENAQAGDNAGARLNSIFANVRLADRGVAENAPPLQYRLAPLGDGDVIFPAEKAKSGPDYQTLWAEFVAALKTLPTGMGVSVWLASLVSLLERYCWCVPTVTTKSLPEVSLFDHSTSMAALTQALLACPDGDAKFLLFGGDLSGIQAFIFGQEEPADKGAVKLLRARSFLLQAVTRSVWLALLRRLKLDPCARIMDAGGRFVLFLPDTPEARAELDKLEDDVEKWLLVNFQGMVRLNFARLGLAKADLRRDVFAARFEDFNEELEKAKLKPFSHAFASGLLPILPIKYADYDEYGECEYCHARPAIRDDGKKICGLCADLQSLGQRLPNTRYIAFGASGQTSAKTYSGLLFDNISLRLYAEKPPAREAESALQILSVKGEPIFTVAPIAGYMPMISKEDIERWQEQGLLKKVDGTYSFMGEECRLDEPKTFNMLAMAARIPPAKPGDPWTSMPCLGVCKADVDNLGLIFSLGLARNFSLSRFAMLARMLNHFFAAYLIGVIRRDYPNIYVVFAGGDDVFVIGPWPDAIAFAQRMAADFRSFCGENQAVTISAGIPLIKPGLPMRAIREEAEKSLETSKDFASGAKNAVTVFNVSAHWQDANKLLGDGEWLQAMCDSRQISRGFLRRLLGYSRECRDFYEGKKLAKNGLYLSHLQYDLARNWKGANAQADEELVRLKVMAQDRELFPKMEMGIAWAIYRTRISG